MKVLFEILEDTIRNIAIPVNKLFKPFYLIQLIYSFFLIWRSSIIFFIWPISNNESEIKMVGAHTYEITGFVSGFEGPCIRSLSLVGNFAVTACVKISDTSFIVQGLQNIAVNFINRWSNTCDPSTKIIIDVFEQ